MKNVIPFLVAGLLLTGCVTSREKHDQRERAIKALNVNSRSNLAAGEAVATGDAERIRPTLQIIEQDEQTNAAIFAATEARLAKLESLSAEVVRSLSAVAQTAVPGAAAAIGKIGDTLAAAVVSADTAKNTVAQQGEAVRQQEGELKQLQSQLKTLAADQIVLEKELDDGQTALKERLAGLGQQATQLAAKVEALPAEEQQRVKAAILQELEDRGVSPEELARYREMTPGQVTALAGVGGTVGLAALAALLRTFGPSRGKKETDEIWDLLKKMEGEQQKLLVTEKEVAEVRAKLEGVQTAKAATEARLAILERK